MGEKKAELVATAKGLLPRNIEELYRLATAFSQSGLVPKQLDSPQKILVAVQMGLEVGLSPMQAVQGIAVINKKPCLYGDAALAVVLASKLVEDFKEEPILDGEDVVGYRCTMRRFGRKEPIIREFTKKDAIRAGLWEKRGRDGQDTPWITYPQRMLQMRARAWAMRDGFADALKGLCIREEVEDFKTVESRVVDGVTAREDELVAEIEAAALPEPDTSGTGPDTGGEEETGEQAPAPPTPEPVEPEPEPEAPPEDDKQQWLDSIEGALKKNWPKKTGKDKEVKADLLMRIFKTSKWAEITEMDAARLEQGFSMLVDILNSDEFV